MGLIPERFVLEQRLRGSLVALPWFGRRLTIDAVFPAGRLAPPRVRRWIEILRALLAVPPT